MMFYNQQDILKVIQSYDDCEELLSDILELKLYDEKDICVNNQPPDINFICSDEKLNKIIDGLITNNSKIHLVD